MEDKFISDIKHVEGALQEAGYVPRDQLWGYALTGDSTYITRWNRAREIAASMDREAIRKYLLD